MTALPPDDTAAPAPAAAPSPAPVAPPPVAPSRGGLPGWLLPAIALAIAAGAIALAWRSDQRLAAVEQELVRREQESAARAAEAGVLAKQAQEGAREAAAKVALLEARVAEVAVQRTQLEELIQSLSRSRDENLLVDIEAAVRMGQQQAAITGSAEPLVYALRQSDERLARVSQPRLEGVRRAIVRDLDRIKATGVTDLAALTLKLDETIRLVDELPMLADAAAVRAASRGQPAAAPAPAASAPDWKSPEAWRAAWAMALQRVGDELRELVRVTRVDRPDAVLLAPENAFFVRENVKLRLLNARLALMSRQFASAQADLSIAQTTLERYFDAKAKRTAGAIELLRQLGSQARQVHLPRPDDTFAALAAVTAGR